jgi:CTP:molybdopterin cytidylyltransferase MocA
MGSIAAVVPAAGFSSRMGLFKPLLPLGRSLLIELTVQSFFSAGIRDVFVVLGHKGELIKPVVTRLEAKTVYNAGYREGMYSSVKAGVRALPPRTEAFFLLPADTPLVSPATLGQLKETFWEANAEVVYPVYRGKKGHPPLIAGELIPAVLQWEGAGGLKELLRRTVRRDYLLPVDDAGILQDFDTEDAYKKMAVPPLADFPTLAECEKIWQKHRLHPELIGHMQEVARVAGIIAENLNSRGYRLHLALLRAACLLHDIAKGEKNHAAKGSETLLSLGYPEVAEIIACHMDLPPGRPLAVSEHTLVYLADKMVKGTKLINLRERQKELLDRYHGDAAACEAVRRRLEDAFSLLGIIENILETDLTELVKE